MGSFHVKGGRPAHSARRAQTGVEKTPACLGCRMAWEIWGKPEARRGLKNTRLATTP
ncbi:hypothetical protein NK6_2728 [Bradyrhizobium diazoefficiens]|uniref:Uncharacterized protein n=1 Tax=Bradyrhizobium diazoefficiens TaxID=1355477 RepID=A0A0E4FSM9_9BRAD|nr:hypothetical protein NK6_2728 [Bradyrhizobium diazoefficiens]